ncbi:unnamed protein product [Adineta steineri]|uniref:Major facilitator superfamily (MFS) profile domain-containing protein n=1 Tax=Adineta steineri TaxID=433720 RepID=A0A813V4E7_9BILA|nr:unnamed protein product [Adineta steineri]CAF1124688.1 unnamed protein product [Adineta steineri]
MSANDDDDDKNPIEQFDEDDEEMKKRRKTLTRKIDCRILPMICIIYLVSYLVRSNIANAKLAGLEADLKITANEYLWSLSIFFVGYTLFEVPSNIVLRRWRPSRWLAVIHMALGIVSMCMGAVQNAAGLLACRFFLGVIEAGLFPGIVYYLSIWYPRKQQAVRVGLFWSISALSGAFSGILAYGISQIGSSSMGKWRLIFIIEGAPNIIVAILCWFLLPDSPEKAKFLNDEERQLKIDSLAEDAGPTKEEKFSWSQVFSVFKDWKAYFYAIIYITGLIALQGITLSLPVIIKEFGTWTTLQTQLMTIPPNMAAFFVILIVSRSSDYFMERSLHTTFVNLFAICGFLMLIFVDEKQVGVLYAGIILAAIGVYSSVSVRTAWYNNNFASLTRRATASAMIVSIGVSGGIVSGQIYSDKQKPRYIIGHTISLVCMTVQTILVIILRCVLMIINKRRKQMSDEQIQQEVDKYGGEESVGDRHPKFQYTL